MDRRLYRTGWLLVLLLFLGVVQASAEVMLPVVYMECDGELPSNGFETANVSEVCGIEPPVEGPIQENATIPEGYQHVSHYYHTDMIARTELETKAKAKSGACYSAKITEEGDWYRLRSELSHNWLCAYGETHKSVHLLSDPITYIQMKLGLVQTTHIH